jgi:hypothetical protein
MAARLVTEVPLKRLTYPRTLDSLGKVCDAVLKDACSREKRSGAFS